MSVYYSGYDLNTYRSTPYFRAHIPDGYPVELVMQKCRAFRRLPERLRGLSGKAKEWFEHTYPGVSPGPGNISDWYSEDGHELDPGTGRALTDAEIDADWAQWPVPNITVTDIPLPPGGFADPITWKEPPPPPEPPDPDEGIDRAQLLADIASHGRAYVAKDYNISADMLRGVKSDEDLADIILARHGKRV